ncbi:Uncharacterised protein [Mycobacteroides abscessus subsp. abscessus]|nr:Uncharacterised protein [Mycobacteroides abscessus subsp. abscessus]
MPDKAAVIFPGHVATSPTILKPLLTITVTTLVSTPLTVWNTVLQAADAIPPSVAHAVLSALGTCANIPMISVITSATA